MRRRSRRVPAPALLARLLRPRAAPPPRQRAESSSRSATAARSTGATTTPRFAAWSEGRTGFPLVDAGMRQLRREGWMHNRARLVVGSFLTKDLGIDWRRGERWFMRLLIDGDEANNNGNWQWIALGRGRPAAGLPADLQPGAPAGALRPGRRLRPPLRARAGERAGRVPGRAVDDARRRPARVRLRRSATTTPSRSSTTARRASEALGALPRLAAPAAQPACARRSSGCRRSPAAGAARAARGRPAGARGSRGTRTGARATARLAGSAVASSVRLAQPNQAGGELLAASRVTRVEAGAAREAVRASPGVKAWTSTTCSSVCSAASAVVLRAAASARPTPQQRAARAARRAQRGALGYARRGGRRSATARRRRRRRRRAAARGGTRRTRASRSGRWCRTAWPKTRSNESSGERQLLGVGADGLDVEPEPLAPTATARRASRARCRCDCLVDRRPACSRLSEK